MKKYLTFIFCLLLCGNLAAQEKYPIPVRTSDQKHGRALSQFYACMAAGINFAKSHGVTPYEYGKYLGNLFAPSWGAGNDFEGFVKGSIYNLESFRHISDAALVVKENEDGSVSVITNDKMWHRYFPEGKGYASYDEFKDCMKGMYEPLGNHMGATLTQETRDTLLVYTFRKK
jgi:hypothetical protein